MFRALSAIGLLVISNTFMTLAWYGQIAFKSKFEKLSLVAIVLISWGVALAEYSFMVPANRLGSAAFGGPFTLWQLKVIQEVISLSVFTLFMLVCMRSEALRWNHIAGFACLILAVLILIPVIWVMVASVKETSEHYGSPWALPTHIHWQNFADAWTKANMGGYMLHSIYITAMALARPTFWNTIPVS